MLLYNCLKIFMITTLKHIHYTIVTFDKGIFKNETILTRMRINMDLFMSNQYKGWG
jgi:hypothetical protein